MLSACRIILPLGAHPAPEYFDVGNKYLKGRREAAFLFATLQVSFSAVDLNETSLEAATIQIAPIVVTLDNGIWFLYIAEATRKEPVPC